MLGTFLIPLWALENNSEQLLLNKLFSKINSLKDRWDFSLHCLTVDCSGRKLFCCYPWQHKWHSKKIKSDENRKVKTEDLKTSICTADIYWFDLTGNKTWTYLCAIQLIFEIFPWNTMTHAAPFWLIMWMVFKRLNQCFQFHFLYTFNQLLYTFADTFFW